MAKRPPDKPTKARWSDPPATERLNPTSPRSLPPTTGTSRSSRRRGGWAPPASIRRDPRGRDDGRYDRDHRLSSNDFRRNDPGMSRRATRRARALAQRYCKAAWRRGVGREWSSQTCAIVTIQRGCSAVRPKTVAIATITAARRFVKTEQTVSVENPTSPTPQAAPTLRRAVRTGA